MIPKNKKQLAVALYNQTAHELQDDPNEWLEFLKFSAKVHKYSFKDQVLLFANDSDAELVADFDQWNGLGRRIKKGQKSIQIFDSKSNRMRSVFDVSQTWGSDFKIFNWELDDQDKENLIEHWKAETEASGVEEIDSLDYQLEATLGRILNSKMLDNSVHCCAKYVIMNRMGMSDVPMYENVARTALAGQDFDELMLSIEQPVKEILLEIEKTLEKNYHKERVLYHERTTRTIAEPTLPDKPDWATVSSRGDSIQSPAGRTGGNIEPVRRDRQNVPDETGGGISRDSRSTEIRGDVLQERQEERGRSTGANRQPVHEVVREETSTRDGIRADSALPDITPTSERDNLSGIQLNNEVKSVAEIAPDFSFGTTVQVRRQLSLFGEVEPIVEVEKVADIDMPEVEIETKVDELSFDIDKIIDQELIKGSGFQDGKFRIYHQLQNEPVQRKRVDFLKQEHGTGGWTSNDGLYVDKSPTKGYRIQLMGNYTSDGQWREITKLTWREVDKRIRKLIDEGRYLNDEELSKYRVLYPEEAKETATLTLFDFDDTPNIETVIHEIVEVEETPIVEHQVEDEVFTQVEDDELIEIIGVPETIEPVEIETASNFKFPDGTFYARTKREKCANNVEAILLLKKLESEERQANNNEQYILAQYTGWGGISEAFDESNKAWEREYEELRSILSTDEYENALDSVLTAYYTDPRLVAEIYYVTEQFGIKPQTILDPAMGTGNFFSRLPESLEDATLYGVELDSITGRIAKQLYPEATIAVRGYEEMPFPDNSFNLVVGNIPFGDIPMNDSRYGKQKFLIHDYFIAKSIDVVKEDGMVAFVTSRGTLDKKDESVRRYIAERADLVGAVRLPSNAFTEIAGTSVTSDVLFFQKRTDMRDLTTDMPTWVQTQPFENSGANLNQYFVDNPQHILGDLQLSGIYGGQSVLECKPKDGQDLYKDFRKAMTGDEPNELDELFKEIELVEEITPLGSRNNTYFTHNDQLYYKTNNDITPMALPQKTTERLKAMCAVRQDLMAVINIQLETDYDTDQYQKTLVRLNSSYDDFVSEHGYFNDKVNRSAFANDVQLPLLLSIEKKSKQDKSISKGDIFFKPTINPNATITHVETAHDALLLSLNRKLEVDLEFMASVSDYSKDELITELDGMIFQDPNLFETDYEGWLYRDEYLSGDIKQKLKVAQKLVEVYPNDGFEKNVMALESVVPAPLKANDIQFQLGSTWIPTSTYQNFMHNLFETSNYYKDDITIEHCKYSNKWRINAKNVEYGNVKVNSTYGTDRINAYEILEKTLNLGQVSVKDKVTDYDANGDKREKLVLNVEETMVARAKQDQIKQKFASWLYEDPTRASELVDIYNEKFNRFVPRNYNGSHLEFPNLSTEWKLRKHQEDVVARILYSRSALMAHEVGAGKTASMIVAGMSLKQVGAIHKPLYVVPSHLTEQFASEFMSMYPTANVLMTTKKDFEKKNRHQFVSKIATNEYDAVIIGHSQFEKIPLSPKREREMIQGQIDEIIDAMKNTPAKDKSWSVKSMVRYKKSLENKMSNLVKQERKDNTIDFEQLGVDFMFIDEAHIYKNLLTVTKLENVAGVSTSHSQRAMDTFMKCRYIQELNNGSGVVFSTGTPISNSMSELYTMQRFLQNDILTDTGLVTFDHWASTFGEITSSLEMTPEGSGYRIRNRFAKFHNLPELMSTFQLVADIRTHEMLDLPTPDLYGDKAQIIVSEPSYYQKEMMADLADRAERIRTGSVDPSRDNMLKITHEARLMAIDPRLLDANAPVDENSKIFQCANNVHRIWEETSEAKSTQLIFSDVGTPKKDEFNVYDEIKNQLMQKGIPEHEIAFIHDPKTDLQREQLFDQVRSGEVRILLGSTSKLGTGTNVQDKLIAGHHIDCPWRPSDLVQRDGRVIRQGNENDMVYMYRYVTKGTFDSYLWQIQEQKLKYISQVMTSKSISRSCSDLDETVLSASEVKAIATSNPLLAEKMTVDNEVARLQLVKNSWENERISLQEDIQKQYPNRIAYLEKNIATRNTELETLNQFPVFQDDKGKDLFSIKLNEVTYNSRTEAFEALTDIITRGRLPRNEKIPIGEYRGLPLSVELQTSNITAELRNLTTVTLHINNHYEIDYYDHSGIGNVTRLVNKVNDLPKELNQKELELTDTKKNLETAKQEITKPFDQEEKLTELLNRQSKINRQIEFGMLEDEKDKEKEADSPNETTEIATTVEDEYEMVEDDQYIPKRLIELKDIPVKEVSQRDYLELA